MTYIYIETHMTWQCEHICTYMSKGFDALTEKILSETVLKEWSIKAWIEFAVKTC